jgi:hypothetical protein
MSSRLPYCEHYARSLRDARPRVRTRDHRDVCHCDEMGAQLQLVYLQTHLCHKPMSAHLHNCHHCEYVKRRLGNLRTCRTTAPAPPQQPPAPLEAAAASVAGDGAVWGSGGALLRSSPRDLDARISALVAGMLGWRRG